jgi:hypothetical protein
MATANLTDMSILALDGTFSNRVQMALTQFCTVTIPAETISTNAVQLHIARKQYASQILNNPATYKPLFVLAVAANQIVANDATAGGTLVGMTPAQIITAAALTLDTDINNAVAAAFNAFVAGI